MAAGVIDSYNVIEAVSKAMGQLIEEAAARHDLTILEFRILDSLANGLTSTPTQCVRHLNVMPARISSSIDRLERHGYVHRKRGQPDRRIVLLDLSDEGRKLYSLAQRSLGAQWDMELSKAGASVKRAVELLVGPVAGSVNESTDFGAPA